MVTVLGSSRAGGRLARFDPRRLPVEVPSPYHSRAVSPAYLLVVALGDGGFLCSAFSERLYTVDAAVPREDDLNDVGVEVCANVRRQPVGELQDFRVL